MSLIRIGHILNRLSLIKKGNTPTVCQTFYHVLYISQTTLCPVVEIRKLRLREVK